MGVNSYPSKKFFWCLAALASTNVKNIVEGYSSFTSSSKVSIKTSGSRQNVPTMGVRSFAKRSVDSLLSRERSREDLKIGIAGFYDRSSKLWEEVWGEHMHHGMYVT